MYKYLILILLPVMASSQTIMRHFESVHVDSTVTQDSLGGTPAMSTSDSKARLFWKAGGDGLVHYYRLYRGTVKMIDSSFSFNSRQDTLVVKFPVITRYNATATDSLMASYIPSPFKIDSIMTYQTGAASLTYNVYRDSAGTMLQLLSSNGSVTSTWTTGSTLGHNILARGDKIWTVVKSISGTATVFNIEIILHAQ